MGCFAAARFALTSVLCSTSAIAKLLVYLDDQIQLSHGCLHFPICNHATFRGGLSSICWD